MPLHLGPLSILFLPLNTYFLVLTTRPGLITLYAPASVSLPILIGMPLFPVVLQPLIGNPFGVPPVTGPILVSVRVSPPGVHIIIKAGNVLIVPPAPVIMARTIPVPFPGTPPIAIPEKQFKIAFRNNVDTVRIRQDNYLRWTLEIERFRDSKPYADINLCLKCLGQESS